MAERAKFTFRKISSGWMKIFPPNLEIWCYILPMFIYLFYGRLMPRPWLTEVRESLTRGGP